MYKNLRILTLALALNCVCAHAEITLTNNKHTITTQSASHLISAPTGIVSLAGLAYCVGNPLERWIMRKSGIGADDVSVARYALWLAKVMAVGAAATKVYGYTHTFTNKAIWAGNAVHALQAQINDYALICMIHAKLAATLPVVSASVQEFKEQFATQIQANIVECGGWKYQLCDDATLECVQALENDMEALQQENVFDAHTVEFLLAMHPDITESLTALFAACDELKVMQTQQPISISLDRIRKMVETIGASLRSIQETLANSWVATTSQYAIATNHCERMATVQTTRDVAEGVYEYSTWRVGQWWNGEEEEVVNETNQSA